MLFLRPEISFDNARVVLDDDRHPLGDFLPVIQHYDMLRDLHDEAHVVLDEQDCNAFVAHAAD
jgi:hypothetical protein